MADNPTKTKMLWGKLKAATLIRSCNSGTSELTEDEEAISSGAEDDAGSELSVSLVEVSGACVIVAVSSLVVQV